jgi:hypothetical protein
MKRATRLLAALALLLGVIGQAQAGPTTTRDLGTLNNDQWLITGAGAKGGTNDTAFLINSNTGEISLTSNAGRTGTFIKGGKNSDFNGYWVADNAFNLPSNVANLKLNFSGLAADDRVVLELNGHILGNANLDKLTGTGDMTLPAAGGGTTTETDFKFTGTKTASGTVTNTKDFVLGGVNHLTLIVNNTGHGADLGHPTIGLLNDSDKTSVGLTASVSYNVTGVPEPTTLALGAISAAVVGFRAWRRKKLAVV